MSFCQAYGYGRFPATLPRGSQWRRVSSCGWLTMDLLTGLAVEIISYSFTTQEP